MSRFLACVLCLSLSNVARAGSAEALAGEWWINGNESHGALVIQVAASGRVSGTIYGQPIRGQFDEATGKVTFTRMRDGNDEHGIQHWTGELTHVDGSQPPAYRLQGSFQSIAGAEFGQPDTDYPWGGEAIRHPPPAVDLQNLQGGWTVWSTTPCFRHNVKLPAELGLAEVNSQVEIRGNQLLWQQQVVATLANDVPSPTLQGEVGFANYRLLLLTLADGRCFPCSYQIRADGVEIAYPHTTACHRGSGQIVYLKREVTAAK
jgi:hypothetical protein